MLCALQTMAASTPHPEMPQCDGMSCESVVVGLDALPFWTPATIAIIVSHRWVPDGDDAYSCTTTYEGHIDWVNDTAVLGGILATASSDRAVMLWNAEAQGTWQGDTYTHDVHLVCQHMMYSTHTSYIVHAH